MPRFRPVRGGERWRDPETGLSWRAVDRSHAELDLPEWTQRRRQRSPRVDGGKVSASDVVVAGGSLLAAYYADEAALWIEAAKLAREFNRLVDRGEGVVNTVGDIRDWVRSRVGVPNPNPNPNSDADAVVPSERRSRMILPVDYNTGSGTSTNPGKPRMILPVDYNTVPRNIYPGKFPPGYRPGGRGGRGGGLGGSARAIRGSVRYEKY